MGRSLHIIYEHVVHFPIQPTFVNQVKHNIAALRNPFRLPAAGIVKG